MSSNNTESIQRDWQNRELVEVVQLNVLQVRWRRCQGARRRAVRTLTRPALAARRTPHAPPAALPHAPYRTTHRRRRSRNS